MQRKKKRGRPTGGAHGIVIPVRFHPADVRMIDRIVEQMKQGDDPLAEYKQPTRSTVLRHALGHYFNHLNKK